MTQDNEPAPDNGLANVVALRGGPVVAGIKTPNENCIGKLEQLLEQAKAGEVIGVAFAILRFDATADFDAAGIMGGLELLGAMRLLEHELVCREYDNNVEPSA